MRKRWLLLGMAALLLPVWSAYGVTYVANFDTSIEGWDAGGDGPYWGPTGGQDGGGYAGGRRSTAGPYLTPPTSSILYGDLAANFGSNVLNFSYYLKSIGGSSSQGGTLYMFGDSNGDNGWDMLWLWTPSSTAVPMDWTRYEWTVDTLNAANNVGGTWTLASQEPGATGSWADSWKNVRYWNFWTTPGSGVDNGIDTVLVTPEPCTVAALAIGGLFALRRRRA